jgi:hypothetical protein
VPSISYCKTNKKKKLKKIKNNELYCYSNEFHGHLPFDRLWLVGALHLNRWAAGSIPAREPIVAFFATAPG